MRGGIVWFSRPEFAPVYRTIVSRERGVAAYEVRVHVLRAGVPTDATSLLDAPADDVSWLLHGRAAEAAVAGTAAWLGGGMLFVQLPTVSPAGVGSFVDALHDHAAAHGLTPQQLVLQCTAPPEPRTAALLGELLADARDAGARVALAEVDGEVVTERSCHAVRPDFLKVAPAVVHQISTPGGLRALDRVLRIAERVGAEVVADQVQTRAQLDLLHACGVDLTQASPQPRPDQVVPEQRQRHPSRRLRLLTAQDHPVV